MFYAQLDENDKVKAITESSKPVSGNNIIEIDSYDISLLGSTYANGEFIAPSIPAKMDFKTILKNLGVAKRKSLWAAAKTNDGVEDFVKMVEINGIGTSDDEWVTNGLSALVSEGVITQAQANNLLGV